MNDFPKDGWLIYKAGRGYYRPGAQGYTLKESEAGRFSHGEAMKHSHPNGPRGPRDGMVMLHEDRVAEVVRKEVRASAAVVLDWIDSMADPSALALAIAQADEALVKAHDASGGNLDAAKLAFARRFVESIALDNAGLIRKLTGGAGNAV